MARTVDAYAGGMRDRFESALTKFLSRTPATDDITLLVKRLAEAVEVGHDAAG